MISQTKANSITQLASDKSSQSRGALLREISDMFFEDTAEKPDAVLAGFESLVTDLVDQTEIDAKTELAHKCAGSNQVPHNLLMKLARDAIEVAAPILTNSTALSEHDLVSIIEQSSQSHMQAIAKRDSLAETVSNALVKHGDDKTVTELFANDRAQISRHAYETVTQRAENNQVLQTAVVKRADTPDDLLADLMLIVSNNLRQIITTRFENLEPGVLEAALSASELRLKTRVREEADYAEAKAFIAKMKLRRSLNGSLLVELLRDQKQTHFCLGFSELINVGYHKVKQAFEHTSMKPMALLCKACGIDKALYTTIIIVRENNTQQNLNRVKEIGEFYDGLNPTDAKKTLTFIRIREKACA